MGIRTFHWDPVTDCILTESDQAGTTIVKYTYESGSYGPLLNEQRSTATYYHHNDASGSTMYLTDDAGVVTDTFAFDAWGVSVARTGTTPTPYQWIGEWGYRLDVSNVSYNIRARTYQPLLSRWTSVDPLWPYPLTSQYNYVDLRPLNTIDASGMYWEEWEGYIWRSTAVGDTLENLASIVSGDAADWVCIWPLPPDECWNYDRAHATAKPCAQADVSNLEATDGKEYELTQQWKPNKILTDDDRLMIALQRVIGGSTFPNGPKGAAMIASQAGYGNSPLKRLVVGGHCAPPTHPCIGGLNGTELTWAWRNAQPGGTGNGTNRYRTAKSRRGPPRCWFTRNAKVYGYGCNTNLWSGGFASAIGRSVRMYTTTTTVWGNTGVPYVTLINNPQPLGGGRYKTLKELLADWR